MKIKRTYGATMREALAQVKLEQGPDAVILGNKKVPGGVEILSALDFDHREVDAYAGNPAVPVTRPQSGTVKNEAVRVTKAAPVSALEQMPDFVFEQNLEGRKEPVLGMSKHGNTASIASPAAPMQHTYPAIEDEPDTASVNNPKAQGKVKRSRALPVEQEALARASNQHDTQMRATQQHETQADRLLNSLRENEYNRRPSPLQSQPVIDEVKDELKNLRDLMQSQLNVLEWDRYSQRHPVRSVLLNLMTELGLGSDICEMLLEQLGPLNADPHKVWQQALALLARSIPITHNQILSKGGRIALVGSTGVGKTTTIAKLAARFAHTHGKHSVALVTTDNFRIGAHEQLQHFARMLEIPLLTAKSSSELSDRLSMLIDKKLVLIDTAGMSQTDVRLSEQFHKLQHGSPEIQPYLVLSANTQLSALNQTIKNFSKAKLAGSIVTKLDEAACLGGIITAAIRHNLALTYCGTGQRVPEDLQLAKNHRLVSKAVTLMQRYAEQVDKESMAFRYNHLIQHKQG